ncbi:MAG TPA: DciA family protein [Acidiferrobacter sp.]|nr:DciA family protein [Acidiferrobacter sp.]
MQDIADILHRSVPVPPADLLSAETLRPIWRKCCSGALQRIEPRFYCRGRLFVTVPGSAFAARLRQEAADLLSRLRREPGLEDLREITVRLTEDRGPPPAAHSYPERHYPQATRCLASLAEEVSDPELKASLARLAGTLSAAGAQGALKAPLAP